MSLNTKNIFGSKSLNRLNIHFGLIRFAENTTNTFGMVVLYQMGYPLYQVFLIWGFCLLSSTAMRSIVPYFLSRFGVKRIVIAGSLIYTGLLPMFALLDHHIIPLWIYIIYYGLSNGFYWYPFHILYGVVGDTENRGKQSALREAYAHIAQGLCPLIAGFALSMFGSTGLIILGTSVFVIAVIMIMQVDEDIDIPITLDWRSAIKNTSMR